RINDPVIETNRGYLNPRLVLYPLDALNVLPLCVPPCWMWVRWCATERSEERIHHSSVNFGVVKVNLCDGLDSPLCNLIYKGVEVFA
mgnify:CR=1